MDVPYIPEIIRIFALAFSVIGAALIIYGGIRAACDLACAGLHWRAVERGQIKRRFTGNIIFGLEFFIASDILTTVLEPTLEDLTLLGVIVLIRVILGYFLEKEAIEFDDRY
ncbi:MAG: DUF1622 domain-containing protein [Methanomicrobiaceae archaeon]|nr:DUF1622 domain-containing protein [Methanomicrobiaceae archaeon]MDD5419388.1 DUF1622 domain-containing protein [Methanomicrobiaceae archaeon]